MSIANKLFELNSRLKPFSCKLIAVSKTYGKDKIMEAYTAGQRSFGENKVQELVPKYEALPKDIEWHLIGHLQSNKVKYIAPFVYMIHSVDSVKLLSEINKEALKNNRIIRVLLQVYIAKEESKFGLSFNEAEELLSSDETKELKNIIINGFMGMATNTSDETIVREEFNSLKEFSEKCKLHYKLANFQPEELSMGMSGDYLIAMEEGSTMVRIGSSIFGNRQ